MDLSVIIVSYNTKALLDRCLSSVYSSLKHSNLKFEVIVLDNLSTDGSNDLLNNKYDQVIKVFNKENLGFGKSNNLGIQMAKGKYILLLNSDAEALDNAIEKLYTFTVARPRTFTGGKLFNEDSTPQPSCGPMFTLPYVFLMLFAKGDALQITRYSPDVIKKVDWVSGACILARKEDFLHTGLFDESIFMYMDEIDLLYRAKQKGYSVVFYPDAKFVHTGAASSGSRKKPVINIYKGMQYFYKKHRSSAEQNILRGFLRIKAYAAIIIGKLIGKYELVSTYEEALRVCQ